jgi:hypothetical protein
VTNATLYDSGMIRSRVIAERQHRLEIAWLSILAPNLDREDVADMMGRPGDLMTRPYLVLVGLFALALAACEENPVGRPCFIPVGDGDNFSNNRVSSPVVDCQSKICLHIAAEEDDLCTARCESDSDCDTSEGSTCTKGFVCMVATSTGNFCCEKLCVCADYLDLPEGQAPPELPQCNPDDPKNECCNLPGREDDEQCRTRT